MHGSPTHLEASADGTGVLILRNPESGRDVVRIDPPEELGAVLPGAVIHELPEGSGLDDVVEAAIRGPDPPRILGVHGGDGSVAQVAHLARRHGLPLLVLPGGTFNHFARALGIDSVATALDALREGSGVSVSVAEVSADGADPMTVLNVVAVGTYPEFVVERGRRMESLGKWLGGAAATWRKLQDATPVAVVRDGKRATVWSVFVSVGRNVPDQVATMQRQTIDDDLLDVRIHHARGSRARAVAALAFGRRSAAVLRAAGLMPREPDLERLYLTELELAVRPATGSPSVYVHDGELEEERAEGYTLRCAIVPDALRVFAPSPAPPLAHSLEPLPPPV